MIPGIRRELTIGYDAALAKLPDALRAEGFGVLTEIDVAATLKAKLGVDFRRYKILGACSPTHAHRALGVELELGVMLPCNVVVYERPDGHATIVAIDPSATMAAQNPALAPIATEVRAHLERVVDAVARTT
jgi:uncharacterized protein (DUF302 family)